MTLDHLPARLKAARKAKGLTQGEVAKLAGVTQAMMSRFENGEWGKCAMHIQTFVKLANALDADPSALLSPE